MKKLIFLGLFVVIANRVLSQSQDEVNLSKYWKYRESLKTYFMKIGGGNGMSLPMSCRIPDWDAARDYETLDIPHTDVTTLEWRDATISLRYYLIVLATQYKLLSENNQEVQSTLNELYYALYALNRVDMTAETYLSGNIQASANPSDLNGFFLRDDVHHSNTQNFANDPPFVNGPIQPDPGHPNQMRADFEGWTHRQEIFHVVNRSTLQTYLTFTSQTLNKFEKCSRT